MIKMIIGLLVGMVLMGALFMGPLSQSTAAGKSADSSQPAASADIAEIYREALISPLQKAGGEIQDADIQQFYQKLLREYNLDAVSPEALRVEQSGLTELLPDIENINQTALSLPLQEAGKNIQDKEIAQFYYKFLKDAGWEIGPD